MIVTPEITLILMMAAGGFALVVMILLLMVARAAGRAAQATAPLTSNLICSKKSIVSISFFLGSPYFFSHLLTL